MKDYSAQEALVESYVRENNLEAAVKLLCELIADSAKGRDFLQAEAFRSKLLKVDPFALPQILECTEIIEDEKNRAIEERHTSLWARLYQTLSSVEGNALYYALEREVYEEGDIVFQQGEQRSKLYFIHHGRLAMTWRDGPRETVLKEVGPGDLVVADGFFSDSVCTISLVALTRVEVVSLDKSILSRWEKEFPALENKLIDFCRSSQDITQLVRKRGVERRRHARIKLHSTIAVQLLDDRGEAVGKPFRGELLDISKGGIAFLVPVRERKTAQSLLGRKVLAAMAIPRPNPRFKATRQGLIVALTHFPFEGHYLHVRFDEVLDENQTELLLMLPRSQPL